MAEGKDNVKVAIRVRPLNERERRETGTKVCLTVQGDLSSVTIDSRPDSKTFTFDYVADTDVLQEEIFEKVGKPISAACVAGYNGTIFAYGQTGAGKTYTILGPESDESFEHYSDSTSGPDQGLMPRCIEHIFSSTGELQRGDAVVEFLIKASLLEIYQEQVIDLLNPSPDAAPLQLREDLKRGVYVDGLMEEIVASPQEAYELLHAGTCNRHTASTAMNKESSRSHCVFTLGVESREVRDGVGNFRSSRFHMIDLAGSERQKSTDAVGERLREAGMINKSLSALGNVINSLVDIAEGKSRHVHYRDSKLTFLLKDSLGGNSKTYIVANISPAASAFGETLSTLKFAQRAKLIRNTAIINEDTSTSTHLLQAEVLRLRSELARQAPLITLCPKCSQGAEVHETELPTVKGKRLEELEALLEVNTRLRVRDAKALEGRVEEMQTMVKTMRTQIDRYEKKAANDKMVLKFRDAAISRLQGQSSCDSTVSDLQSEVSFLREQLESCANAPKLFAENERLKLQVSELAKEVAEDPESLMVRYRENREYTEQVVQWLNEDLEAREKARGVFDEYQRMVQQRDEWEREKTALGERVKELEESAQRDRQQWEKEREELKSGYAEMETVLTAKHTDLESVISALQSQIAAEKSATALLEPQVQSFQLENRSLQVEIQALQEAVKSSGAELESLRQSHSHEIETLKERLEQARREIGDLKDQREELELCSDGLTETIKEQEEELEAAKEAFAAEREALSADLQALKGTIAQMKKQCQITKEEAASEVQTMEKVIGDLKQKDTERCAEIESLQRELIQGQATADIIARLESDLSSLQTTVAEKDLALVTAKSETQQQSATVERLSAELRAERLNSAKAASALSALSSSHESTTQALRSEIESANCLLQSTALELEATKTSLKAALSDLQDYKDRPLQPDSSFFEQELSDSRSQLLSLQQKCQRLEQALDQERATASLDLDHFSQVEKERDKLEEVASELRDTVTELSAEVRLKEAEVERLRSAEKAAKEAVAEALESEGRLHEETARLRMAESDLRSCIDDKSSECDRLLSALRTAQESAEVAALREVEYEDEIHSLTGSLQSIKTDYENAANRIILLTNMLRDRERECESLTTKVAEMQQTVDRYQRVLADSEAQLTAARSALGSTQTVQETAKKGRVEELERALEASRAEVKTLKEESKLKLEVLQNTSRNIIATRQEIEMWKTCLDEKNESIHQLKHALRKSEEDRVQLQARAKPCTHDEELQLMKSLLDRREKELLELKEKGQLYYAQADEAIAAQRLEIEHLNKQLGKCREEMRTAEERRRHRSQDEALRERPRNREVDGKENERKAKVPIPRSKDEVALLKLQVLKLTEELGKKNEELESLLSTRHSDDSMHSQCEQQIDSLSSGLNKITEYVFSLPIVPFNPEETGIVESTIQAIGVIYDAYESKCRELQSNRVRSQDPAPKPYSEQSSFINPANFKNPVAHYHALLNSSSLKADRKSPLPGKRS